MKNSGEEKERPLIKEVIVVEGRDDTAAINRAVRGVTIETHGFGISKTTWDKLEKAYEKYGLIIFTDPDHAGEEIRKKLTEKFPCAKQAFLAKEKAKDKKEVKAKSPRPDIGIENASPEDIFEALKKAKAPSQTEDPSKDKISAKQSNYKAGVGSTLTEEVFSADDLFAAGLTGGEEAKSRREKLGDILGIGYANSKGLLKKLNILGISKEEFEEAIKKL